MLNLDDIRSRVDRGVGTSEDVQSLLREVERLYGQPSPPEVIALEAAQASQVAAQAAAERAAQSAVAAQKEAQAAAERAATAKAVADAAQKAADDKAAQEKASADAAVAAALLSQKQAVAESLKSQLGE